MEGTACQYPGCERPSIGRCEDCQGEFCSRHIWQAVYDRPAALCAACHQRLAVHQRDRVRASIAYTAILVVLMFAAAGISYSLHYLRHIDADLTKWMFWLFVGAFVVAAGRLGLLLMRL